MASRSMIRSPLRDKVPTNGPMTVMVGNFVRKAAGSAATTRWLPPAICVPAGKV